MNRALGTWAAICALLATISIALAGIAFGAQTNDQVNLWHEHAWFKLLIGGSVIAALLASYVLLALFIERLPLLTLRGERDRFGAVASTPVLDTTTAAVARLPKNPFQGLIDEGRKIRQSLTAHDAFYDRRRVDSWMSRCETTLESRAAVTMFRSDEGFGYVTSLIAINGPKAIDIEIQRRTFRLREIYEDSEGIIRLGSDKRQWALYRLFVIGLGWRVFSAMGVIGADHHGEAAEWELSASDALGTDWPEPFVWDKPDEEWTDEDEHAATRRIADFVVAIAAELPSEYL